MEDGKDGEDSADEFKDSVDESRQELNSKTSDKKDTEVIEEDESN